MAGSDEASTAGAWARAMNRLRRVQRMLLYAGGGCLALHGLGVCAVLLLSLPGPRVMLPGASGWLVLAGFFCLASGTVLAMITTRRAWPLLSVTVLAFVPGALVVAFALLVLEVVGRPTSELDRIALPDGRVAMLGMDWNPTDAIYSLWLAEGLGWRRALSHAWEITYSEDGSFTADPGLALAPDGRRLLIRRGGIWTDCFEVGDRFKPCSGISRAGLVDFRARSAEIERLLHGPG